MSEDSPPGRAGWQKPVAPSGLERPPGPGLPPAQPRVGKRESDALALLARLHGLQAGRPLVDDCDALEWMRDEIAAFVRAHGPLE